MQYECICLKVYINIRINLCHHTRILVCDEMIFINTAHVSHYVCILQGFLFPTLLLKHHTLCPQQPKMHHHKNGLLT